MVVLDRDYLTVPVDEIRDTKPTMTIVNGEPVFQRQVESPAVPKRVTSDH